MFAARKGRRRAAPIELARHERAVLREALRRGATVRGDVDSAVSAYGAWLFESVFGGDAAAALGPKTTFAVWRSLVRHAGSERLRVSRRILYVALHLAALDHVIADGAWRRLDAGRKEVLLPLATEDRLRIAARYVLRNELTVSETRAYVTEVLALDGRRRATRLTLPRLVRRIEKLRRSLDTAQVREKVARFGAEEDELRRGRVADEIEDLRLLLAGIAKALRAT